MGEDGILLKFSGPWRLDAGVEELFLPISENISLADLMEKIGNVFGKTSMSRSDGLVCLFDENNGPRAIKPDDIVSPGSTLLFLGTVESG